MNEQQKIIDLLTQSLEEKNKLIDNYTKNQITLISALNKVSTVIFNSDLYTKNNDLHNKINDILIKSISEIKY